MAAEAVTTTELAFEPVVTGLQPAAHMPILFQGRTWDLANLTPQEYTYLLQFPTEVPYLTD